MPFVTQEHREKPDSEIPGDRCYFQYKMFMKAWEESPRWTTVDQMLETWIVDDDERAFFLAFMVFFALHVMPYELKKRDANGDI